MLAPYEGVSTRSAHHCQLRFLLIRLLSSYSGFLIFVAGLLTYTWLRQEHAVAIVGSLAALVSLLFIR